MKKNCFIIGAILAAAACTKGPSEPSAECKSAIEYYKSNGVSLTKKDQSDTPEKYRLAYAGHIPVQGTGIISSKPVNVMCSKDGAVTIWGADIKVDKQKTAAALKSLSQIFLVNSSSLKASDSQKSFFNEVAGKLQPDNEWREKIDGNFVIRVITTQADARGNYFLTIHAGNAASYKK